MLKISERKKRYPARASEVLVTQAMLYKVRDELKDFVKSEIHGLKSEIRGLKSENHGIKSEIHEMKSEIHEIRSDIHGLKSEVHRMAVLIEEQNAKNSIVLEGLAGLFHRQDRLEGEFYEFRKTINR